MAKSTGTIEPKELSPRKQRQQLENQVQEEMEQANTKLREDVIAPLNEMPKQLQGVVRSSQEMIGCVAAMKSLNDRYKQGENVTSEDYDKIDAGPCKNIGKEKDPELSDLPPMS